MSSKSEKTNSMFVFLKGKPYLNTFMARDTPLSSVMIIENQSLKLITHQYIVTVCKS